MATMQTPKMYLGVQGMPKKLPVKDFSSELNKALMAKDDTEMAAAAMFIQCRRGRKAFSMDMLIIDVEEQMVKQDGDSGSDCEGYDPEIFANNIVALIIKQQLEEELTLVKAARAKKVVKAKAVAMKVVKAKKVVKSKK